MDSIDISRGGVEKQALLTEVKFLHSLLQREFIYKLNPDEPEVWQCNACCRTQFLRSELRGSAGQYDQPRHSEADPSEPNRSCPDWRDAFLGAVLNVLAMYVLAFLLHSCVMRVFGCSHR